MARLALDQLSKIYRSRGKPPVLAVDRVDLAGRATARSSAFSARPAAARPHAAHDRRLRGRHRRRDPRRRAGRSTTLPPGAARRRHGVRGLCALSAADHPRQYRLRAAARAPAARAEVDSAGRARSPSCSRSATSSTAIRPRSRPASSSAPASPAPWSAAPTSRCSTSRCRQLEPQLRAILRARIKDYLIEHKMTTMFVTHDQTEAIALADRIAVMEAGRAAAIRHAGRAEGAARPTCSSRSFIGEPPMNIVRRPHRAERRRRPGSWRGPGRAGRLHGPAGRLAGGTAGREPTAASSSASARTGSLVGDRRGCRRRVISNQWLGDQTHLALDLGGCFAGRRGRPARSTAPVGEHGAGAPAARSPCICSTPASGSALLHGLAPSGLRHDAGTSSSASTPAPRCIKAVAFDLDGERARRRRRCPTSYVDLPGRRRRAGHGAHLGRHRRRPARARRAACRTSPARGRALARHRPGRRHLADRRARASRWPRPGSGSTARAAGDRRASSTRSGVRARIYRHTGSGLNACNQIGAPGLAEAARARGARPRRHRAATARTGSTSSSPASA